MPGIVPSLHDVCCDICGRDGNEYPCKCTLEDHARITAQKNSGDNQTRTTQLAFNEGWQSSKIFWNKEKEMNNDIEVYNLSCAVAYLKEENKALRDNLDLNSELLEHSKTLIKKLRENQHPLTFHKFSEINRARSESPEGFNHKLNDWSLSDWFTATMGELGEAANVCKKLNRYRDGITGNKKPKVELEAQLKSEIADTFIYLDLLAQAAGFKLGNIVMDTFNAKSKEIGYNGN